jgi:hypothetical protein
VGGSGLRSAPVDEELGDGRPPMPPSRRQSPRIRNHRHDLPLPQTRLDLASSMRRSTSTGQALLAFPTVAAARAGRGATADSARPTCRAARAVLPTPRVAAARADPEAAADSPRVTSLQLWRTSSPRRISLLALTEGRRPSSGGTAERCCVNGTGLS